MQQIAESGGGRYYRATDGGSHQPGWPTRFNRSRTGAFRANSARGRWSGFQLFLLASALCLALAELTTDRLFIPRRTRRQAPSEGA